MSFISLVVTIFVMFTVLNFVADVIQNRYDVEHIKTWIVAMELCDEDAALAECRLSSRFSDRVPYLLHGETLRRFHAALKKCEDAKERQNARKHAVKIAEESSPGEMAKLILSGVYYDSQLVAGIDEKEYAELFFYAMTQCLALGRVGLTNELLLYHEIVTVADCRRKILEDRLSKEPLTLPEDWDDIVLEQFDNPSIKLLDQYARLTLEEVRSLAGRAVTVRDVPMAKVVLAYCVHDDDTLPESFEYREVIGDSIMGDLIRMVADRQND